MQKHNCWVLSETQFLMEFLKSTPKRLLCLSWRRQDVGFKGAGGLQDLRRMYDISISHASVYRF
jgi:hypothetical protein